MPIRGSFRGTFRGRGPATWGRGLPPPRHYPGMMVTETSFEQMHLGPQAPPPHVADMDFTADVFPAQMTDPNSAEAWDNGFERKRPRPTEFNGPSKKPCLQGPLPGPLGLPSRPLLPGPMGPATFGRPPRPIPPPFHEMGPPVPLRHFGPGFRGPPPPMPRGPTRFPPPPFNRPGPPVRPMGFRPPPGPPRGFPNGVRAPPGARPGRGGFGYVVCY